MKSLDVFLLRATPFVVGLAYFIGVSLLEKYDLIKYSVFFYITGVSISLLCIGHTFATNGSFSRYRGQGLLTIRFLFFIQLLFFIALTIINITSVHIFEPNVILILNSIGLLVLTFYFGIVINSITDEYIKKNYQ